MADADEETFIVNDVLCYVQCMMDTLPKEQLVELVHAHYKGPELVAAREVLYTSAPADLPTRLIRHKVNRDIIGSLYDVMQLLGVHAPKNVFTCRNLRNVPPITLKNVDPVMLLHQTSEVKAEIAVIKNSNQQQMDIVMEAVEQLRKEVRESQVTILAALPPTPKPAKPSYTAMAKTNLPDKNGSMSSSASPSQQSARQAGGGVKSKNLLKNPIITPSDHQPTNIEDGHAPPSRRGRLVTDEDGFSRYEKPRRERRPPVIGTGQRQRLRVVREVRRCDVFVSRLHPDTTVEELTREVEDIIGEAPLSVIKLRTRHPSYASFHVTAAEAHRSTLLSTEAWDEGTLVRNYFVSKTYSSRSTDGATHGSSHTSLPKNANDNPVNCPT